MIRMIATMKTKRTARMWSDSLELPRPDSNTSQHRPLTNAKVVVMVAVVSGRDNVDAKAASG
jgi:hypothetical protein